MTLITYFVELFGWRARDRYRKKIYILTKTEKGGQREGDRKTEGEEERQKD